MTTAPAGRFRRKIGDALVIVDVRNDLPPDPSVVPKATARESAAYYGFRGTELAERIKVFEDGVRAVNMHAGDGERALREMISSGVRLRSADALAA